MEQVGLGREEDDVAGPGPRQPGARVVKGGRRVLDAAVVGRRRDQGGPVLLKQEVVPGGCCFTAGAAAGWGEVERKHVEVHLRGEALRRPRGG